MDCSLNYLLIRIDGNTADVSFNTEFSIGNLSGNIINSTYTHSISELPFEFTYAGLSSITDASFTSVSFNVGLNFNS